ncbi:MAG: hypothetical protein GNW80_15465 [Asgard group archaeon]|nr:hypothetical protein [Asgard group archaeon]
MKRKKSLAIISIIIFGLFIGSKVSFVRSLLITDYQGDLYRVVNNVLVENQLNNQPSIDITNLTTYPASSEIILSVVGEPVIDSSHGYRVIIDWNKPLGIGLIGGYWPNVTWEKIIASKSNFTVCYAGGVNDFGVANGSYSEFYNSSGSLLFSELNNNSIILDEKSIIFTVNQTFAPTTPLNAFNETLSFTTYNAIIFTNYNTTETHTNGTTILNVVWMDSLPESILYEVLFRIVTLDSANPGIMVVVCTIGLVGVCQVVYLKRRKKQ